MRKLSKIFLTIGCIGLFASIVVLIAHTYFSNYHFNIINEYPSYQSQFLEPKKKDLSILVVSDTGSYDKVLTAVLKEANESEKNYDFIIHLGDFITKGAITNYYWLLNKIKPLVGQRPFFTIPGNHDITQRIGLSKQFFVNKAFYSSVMGARDYWFGYGDTLFIAFDSSDIVIDDKSFTWLNDTLKNIRPLFKHCIIISHMPPKNTKPDYFEDHMMSDSSIQRFKDIVTKYKIDAMLFGHVHYWSKSNFYGIPIYTAPASGQSIRDKQIHKYGYIDLQVGKKGIKSIEPKFIEFHGNKKTPVSEWLFRDIFSHRVTLTLNILFTGSVLFFLCSLICYVISNKKHR